MIIKRLISLCAAVFVTVPLVAISPEKPSNDNTLFVNKVDKRMSALMADRVTIRKNLAIKELAAMNAKALADIEERERLMYPADELYNSCWDDEHVDLTRNNKLEFPDSCEINCSNFTIPIDHRYNDKIRITSPFGPRWRRMHYGIDLDIDTGDTIRAAFDGKVRMRKYDRYGYGYYLVIRHPNGLETVYGHLSKFFVHENSIVRSGDAIALGGSTGRSTGSHLHFETRFLGKAINPAEIIDFGTEEPRKEIFVFHNIKIRGRKSNIYTTSKERMVYYRIKRGDSLGKIAHMYGTTISQLCYLNGLRRTSVLRIGQSIRCSTRPRTKTTHHKTIVVKKTQKSSTTLAKTTKKGVTDNTATTNEIIYHKIRTGDSLYEIALHYGTTVNKLCELNNIHRNTILKLGKKLRCS